MFNFLVTARADAWKANGYEFERSRFLEFTNDKISEQFSKLNDSKVDFLKSIPCIFAYEGFVNDFLIGRLTAIKDRGSKIFIEYEIDRQASPIDFSELEKIFTQLDIRKWELYRTHWAIKDEDLFDRLSAANILHDQQNDRKNFQSNIELPPESENNQAIIESVQGFISRITKIKKDGDSELFYRGHSNRKKYKLEPSLFRKDDKGNYTYLNSEDILYRELIVSNSPDFSSDEYTLDRLIRMQHYSLPTRLLDITSNPLIALYFACKSNNPSNIKGAQEKQGEVIIFSIKRRNIKYFDSDTASCLANLARLPDSEKNLIDFSLEKIEFNNQIPVKRLLHLIMQEKPFFENRIVASDLKSVICVKGKKNNARISSQSGAFLLFGVDAILSETGTSDITVTRICVKDKEKILAELDLLNINESTVFPNIESSAKYVAKKYRYSPAED